MLRDDEGIINVEPTDIPTVIKIYGFYDLDAERKLIWIPVSAEAVGAVIPFQLQLSDGKSREV